MYSLNLLAEKLDGVIKGDSSIEITKIATLSQAKEGDISFCTNPKYLKDLSNTKASAVLITEEALDYCNTNAIVLSNPYMALAKVMEIFDKSPKPSGKIHSKAVIAASAVIGDNVTIDANAVIGENVVLGDNVVIGACATIEDGTKIGDSTIIKSSVSIAHDVIIGAKCIIHQNAVIGCDGFGNARDDDGSWTKIPQLGRVVIEDNVEIGANTTVDRGAIDDTIIKKGARIDNLVQIAHNVVIGENTALAGVTAVAGSTKIGSNCLIGGQSAITGHISICDNAVIGGASNVGKSVTKPGMYYAAFEVKPRIEWGRFVARLSKIDKLIARVKDLENKLIK
ncbi:UDP-3-O-(3-hydroxymyristoyl)glucosamine N-acyltransferase [Allofrancisella frigidaquae]|uniref:UDP-3-O-acylglucosamine N-acyltransferase n=1 Tax=Allofrancisella frigidaquae TaxID=1085644 RepID=A0A6M3HS97_9GAMM|nr:UDP-3-O-(3-hydroxymyristoyl)glucosamine N-acyltransferase [Allofrancisella frigidaquae]KEI34685.1 UDP-3-O-[3-hydroxymyristoyl] glucosamine N-acyltransferase [Francisella sp. W12-1067]QIV94088.1 UDP-3-O-(3-hydroxymyristoyl)glucosamine N-acyltransferase [Allofrancisella frigidaquae]